MLFRRCEPDYIWEGDPIDVDFAGGMFVAFRREAFEQIGGFDERFFMYWEDVDIFRRLKKMAGGPCCSQQHQPTTSVIYNAQRASRRSLQHMKWYLASAFRFLFSPPARC